MTLSSKKANCGDHLDRISDFPCNVIDGILEHLNMRDIVRTSILSKKWRYTWISFPRLEFDKEFFNQYDSEGHVDRGPEVSSIIMEVLLVHNEPIYKFTLFIPYDFNITFRNLSEWILFLAGKGVNSIQLLNDKLDFYRMPSHFFSCQELTHVRICRFNLSVPPSFCGFKNLLYLHVERIKFESGALENLISSSSSLEELYIVRCFGYKCIDLSSSTLKVFQIEYGHAIKSFCLEKAKNLTDLTLVYYRNGVSSLTKKFPKIQRLTMGLGSKVS